MHRDSTEAILQLYKVVSESGGCTLSDKLVKKYELARYLNFLKEEGIIDEEEIDKGYVKGNKILGLDPDEEIISKESIGRIHVKKNVLEERIVKLVLPIENPRLELIERNTGQTIFQVYDKDTEFYVYLLRHIPPKIDLLSNILEKYADKPTLILYPRTKLVSLCITLLFTRTIACQYIMPFETPSTVQELEQLKNRIKAFVGKARPLDEILYKYATELEGVYKNMKGFASIIKYNPLLLIRLLSDIEYAPSKSSPKDAGLPIDIRPNAIHKLAEYTVALALAYIYHPNVYLGKIGERSFPDIIFRRDNEIVIVDVKCYKDPRKLPSKIRSELRKRRKDKKYFTYIPIAKEHFGLKDKQTHNTLVFMTSRPVSSTTAREVCEAIKEHNIGQWKFEKVVVAPISTLRLCLERLFAFKGPSSKDLFSSDNLEYIDDSFCARIHIHEQLRDKDGW